MQIAVNLSHTIGNRGKCGGIHASDKTRCCQQVEELGMWVGGPLAICNTPHHRLAEAVHKLRVGQQRPPEIPLSAVGPVAAENMYCSLPAALSFVTTLKCSSKPSPNGLTGPIWWPPSECQTPRGWCTDRFPRLLWLEDKVLDCTFNVDTANEVAQHCQRFKASERRLCGDQWSQAAEELAATEVPEGAAVELT
jgi:hypothetical protein